MGRGDAVARLLAISFLIYQGIEHGQEEGAFRALAGICAGLGYDQARFKEMMRETAVAYEVDRGRDLIARAFSE